MFAALRRTIEKIVDPFDTDEFRRNCPAPTGCSHRLHCARRGLLPQSFECGIWTHGAEVPPHLRELVELGLNDCDMVNWPREALAPKDLDLAKLWDPLPPPGYSAFELINSLKRPADVDPVTFMINQLIQMTFEERYCVVKYVHGEEVREWLDSYDFGSRRTSVARFTVEELLSYLNVAQGIVTLQYIQRLYEIEFVRRFRPYETSFLISQFRKGLKPLYRGSPAYVYLRTDCPARLPEVPKLRFHPKTIYSRIFEFEETHPLNYVYVAFGRTPHHLYCLPAQITLLDFALLLSVLTPVGRQCLCDFYNKHGKIPAVLYWTWVVGASQSGEGFEIHRVSPFARVRTFDCFARKIPMNRESIRHMHCRADCGPTIILRSHLKLDDFSAPFEWVLPDLLALCTEISFSGVQWSPLGPNYVSTDITNCGILGPDFTSLVCSQGRYYYRVIRHGQQRDIPLTRYPSHADLRSDELRQAVDRAFAPNVGGAECSVEGESPLSNPALSSAGPTRD